MYNLLMSHNVEEWELPEGQVSYATFSLARFLEYTEKQIEDRLQPVGQAAFDFVALLPAVFMSELQFEGDKGFVHFRVGKVTELSIDKNEIHYKFQIYRNAGRLFITNRTHFEAAFEMGRMEIHRTHWAIKQRHLAQALDTVGFQGWTGTLFGPGGIGAPPPPGISTSVVVPPPPAPKPIPVIPPPPMIDLPPVPIPPAPETIVDSVEAFVTAIMRLETEPDEEIFFRGHGNKEKYKLIPTLFRKHENGSYRYLPKEDILVRELLTARPAEFSTDKYMLDHLVRMQHYGLPTRLLDVSSNPLVALYFSCSDMESDTSGNEIPGEVIILSTKTSDVKFFDSDKVSCITCLSLLTDAQKNLLNTELSSEDFKDTDPGKRLLDAIKREKPHFQEEIDPKHLKEILFVRGRLTHERISSQSGAFLLFGLNAILEETGHSHLNVRRITVRNKAHILKGLARFNIKASTVYPGIEKTATDITRLHELPVS